MEIPNQHVKRLHWKGNNFPTIVADVEPDSIIAIDFDVKKR